MFSGLVEKKFLVLVLVSLPLLPHLCSEFCAPRADIVIRNQ